MVRKGRLELPRVAPLDSKSSASTNSATLAPTGGQGRHYRRRARTCAPNGPRSVSDVAGGERAGETARAPACHGMILLAGEENWLSTPVELYAVATKYHVPDPRFVTTYVARPGLLSVTEFGYVPWDGPQ